MKRVGKRLPYVGRVVRERDQLRQDLAEAQRRLQSVEGPVMWVPAGHYYSPIPPIDEVRTDDARIFAIPEGVPGVDLRDAEQVALLETIAGFYSEIPFPEAKRRDLRFAFENPAYSYSDAIFLYGMLRHLRPRRVIEVGSGYSSSAMLDTNDRFFGGAIQFTFIDPYPETLHSVLRPSDKDTARIVPSRVQDVDLGLFAELDANDILFIDSTHVARIGSDVNHLFFEVLPRLRPGVYIHFHDIFYPFEYPRFWVYEGRAWNEAYLLRAFLTNNSSFSIQVWNDYLAHFHRDRLQALMPACLKNTGASIWIKRNG